MGVSWARGDAPGPRGHERTGQESLLRSSGSEAMGGLHGGPGSLGSTLRLHLPSPMWPWEHHTPPWPSATPPVRCRHGADLDATDRAPHAADILWSQCRLISLIAPLRGREFWWRTPASFNAVTFWQRWVHISGVRGSNWPELSCSCALRDAQPPPHPVTFASLTIPVRLLLFCKDKSGVLLISTSLT